MIFIYDGTAKSQAEFSKNVYKGYLSSAEKRSLPEKLFERYCENSKNIQWFYKNGNKGIEYFSIVYTDNFGKQKSFYPDYVIGTTDGRVWIIETKGGFTKSGDSEDIDKYTAKKFGVLKAYTDKYNLLGALFGRTSKAANFAFVQILIPTILKVTVGNCYPIYYKGGKIKNE